ncbi:MAG: hypothetical protein HY934_04315 [Candidatus Firestonebacteria bacterium]|nr:hypothetical protein [Candidatus Firestonebacteria bacterium]
MITKMFFLKNLIILLFSILTITCPIYAENDEGIGYIFYDNQAVTYRFNYSIPNTTGEIFLDNNNILHVINQKGSFEFDTAGKLSKQKDELEQIPINIDAAGNMFIRDKNIIKKINDVGKLVYTLDIIPGDEFIHIDKKEQYYFLSKRDVYENYSYERENLIKDINEYVEEREKLDTKDSPFFRDYDYYRRQYKDNEQKMIEMQWTLNKLIDGYEHIWKSNVFMSSLPHDQQIDYNNRLNNLYDDIKRKKEDLYDYQTQQYDLRKKQEDLQISIADRKYELQQKEKEARLKLKELDKQIETDRERKYMIKIVDNQEQIVKRIPIIVPAQGVPLWECVNIIVDNDRIFYGINHDRIYIYDEEGRPLCSFGKYGIHPGEIIKPVSIAVDSKKSLYVVDSANNNILKFIIK